MSLRIHRAASVEDLVDGLARRLVAAPPPDPFTPVDVAVPSRGMERWLAQRLADRLGAAGGEAGVCANVRFPFPGHVVQRVLAAVLPDAPPDADPWAPRRLVWPVLALLDDLPDEPRWRPLRAHLDEDGSRADRRRFPLARRIADLFDRYALHRPELVARWAAGEDVDAAGRPLEATTAWQPPLWRDLIDALDVPSPDARFTAAIAALADGAIAHPEQLPGTVDVFGVLGLPRLQLELLAAAADHVDVAIHAIAPVAGWRPGVAPDPPAHPLLAGSGMAARAAHAALAAHEPAPGPEQQRLDVAPADAPAAGEGDATPDGDVRALDLLRADLRADRPRGPRAAPPLPLRDGDRSVQVHACHGPMRQLEVLREVIYGLLADDATLQPRDIVVLTPDIEAHDPLITAVFSDGGAGTGVPRLRFRVADRTLRDDNVVAQALTTVLELVSSRVGASAVVDLLGTAPLRARFDLTPADVAALPGWVLGTGISWGMDAEHRRGLIDLDDPTHTWHAGLDRLVLGAAMADDGLRMVGGVVPYDVEGGGVELLGRLATATDALFACLRGLRAKRPVAAWRDALAATVDALLDPGPGPRRDAVLTAQLSAVREAIAGIVRDSEGPDDEPSGIELTLEELRSLLGDQLGQRGGAAHYGTGAITFTGLVGLRNVPHRVVCLLGMDDGALPRTSHRHGFDLIAQHPEDGDPDPRIEDRQLLLDAVLAAQEHLVVTYTGHDARTNERQQPAVPISELLDVLDDSLVVADGATARDLLVIDHPLQPHSARYFGGDRTLRAFDRRQLAAAVAATGEREHTAGFLADAPLPPPSPDELDPTVVELSDLVRFLEHPLRHLLQRRVGVALAEDDRRLEDRDPTELDALERWKLGNDLLVQRLGGAAPPGWRELTLACGTVPVGGIGQVELEGIEELVGALCSCVAALGGSTTPVPIDVTVPLPPAAGLERLGIPGGARRLVGSVDVIGDVVPEVNVSTLKGKHRLRAWVRLLAVTAERPELGATARLLGKKGSKGDVEQLELGPVPADPGATALLGDLIALYLRGHVEPVAAMPNIGHAYACARFTKQRRDRAAAIEAVAKDWAGDPTFSPGEQLDAYVIQALGADLDLEDLAGDPALRFTADTERIWEPIVLAERKAST